MTPSAARKQAQASAKKAANAERKAQISDIGSKRDAIENAKVCNNLQVAHQTE